MSATNPEAEAEAELHANSLFETIASLKARAKAKTQEILHIRKSSSQREFADEDIFSDPAFDPAQALDKKSPSKNGKTTSESVTDGLKDAKYLLSHPRRVMRSKATHVAAEKIGSARHPIQILNRDEELIDAHDHLAQAAADGDSDSTLDGEEVNDACDRILQVENQRESLQTAWILGRHVNRVKAVRSVSRPEQSDFTIINDGEPRVQWERYLGKLALYHTQGFTLQYVDDFKSPPFDLEDLARIIERLTITSAPWQTFLMKVRDIYTWKDPRSTAKCAILFWTLWYTEHIVGSLWFWIIYSSIRSKLQPSSVERIRESVARSFDREKRVQAWGELLQQHGKQNWIEPLLDDLGPHIQRQLGDLADFLEILTNFHRHERPKKTTASLFFFASCLTVTLFADMAFCVKFVWFIAGVGFFFTYPIATRYPKYRLLVSPWRWMFWAIPTHAELAILRLQEKAAIRDADPKEFELPHPDGLDKAEQPQSGETHSFDIHHETGGRGKLIISRSGIAYTSVTEQQSWPFSSLAEMCKSDDPDTESVFRNFRRLGSRSGVVLHFTFFSAELRVLVHTADRNRVFNLVLAWSGLKWQSLQIERRRGGRGNLDTAIKRALR
ncbi:uncharacterized protein A1O9_09262 [Exophiala aquamarina CBS 119918]|uniref:Uncharacterized protein n=1 Tax=Exophiala aquamarina CBS 119918 TaxID=1182545 RepID=A0A072PH35_9EURO|nr:uncharacterized protein A1O9_09262 [Exophiala aquamarina CBS 119918]KEF54820.1 hypothetical protein A1O9_09262 [Exophiala aquamarina CBS 119918]